MDGTAEATSRGNTAPQEAPAEPDWNALVARSISA